MGIASPIGAILPGSREWSVQQSWERERIKLAYSDAPCPFCGGTDISEHYIRDGAEVRCKCGASVHKFQPNALPKARLGWRQRASCHDGAAL